LDIEYINGYPVNYIGKRYDDYGKLQFIGKYYNGKKHGKGKEYYYKSDILKFEGEYLYGEKRRGKAYYKDGKLEYEGDYLLHKKFHGKGYDKNGNIIYELINGNGKVIEYDERGVIEFEGEYLNGKKMENAKNFIIIIWYLRVNI